MSEKDTSFLLIIGAVLMVLGIFIVSRLSGELSALGLGLEIFIFGVFIALAGILIAKE